jgi:zinc protease
MSFTPVRAANGLYELKHKSGLTVLLYPKPGLKVTTANITYHVGSRNEGLGVRGGTHYLEHGMFKGSVKFHGKNGMWKLEEMGAYMNATTYNDRTNYFSVIESEHLEDVVAREADRMYQPLLCKSELDKEMTVVRNEMERGNNNDFEVLQKQIMATAFNAHPYHHSTIGFKSEVETISAVALKKFHDTFYRPSNATYTFCGNFKKDDVLNMIDEYFDKEDKNSVPEMLTTEPAQMGQRRVMIKRPTNCALMCVAFKAPNGLHKDAIVLDVISKIIAHGPTAMSEKYKKDRSCHIHDILAEWERMRDPYLFCLWATTNQNSEEALKTAESKLMEITSDLQSFNDGKSLERAKTVLKNKWKNEMMGTRKTAMAINEAIARGDAFDVFQRNKILDEVTMCDVMRVSKDIFQYDRSTVGYLRGLQPNETQGTEIEVATYNVFETNSFELDDIKEVASKDFEAQEGWTPYESDVMDVRVSLQTPENSYTVNSMLSKMMTKGFKVKEVACTEPMVANYISEKNIQRNILASSGAIHSMVTIPFSEKSVASNFILGELHKPLLEEKAFKYLQRKWLSELYGSKNSVNTIAKIRMNQCLFNEDDPNYMLSMDDLCTQVSGMKLNDVKNAHSNLVSAPLVATIISKQNIPLTNNGTWNLEYVNSFAENLQDVEKHMEGKSSTVLKYGMVVEYSDALKLAVGVLGNGFTGRLMKIVRDQHGLTYGINAQLKKMKGCGILVVTGTFAPSKLEEGIVETEKVLAGWKNDILTEDEVEIQKQNITGSLRVQYDTPGALANAIHHTKLAYGSVDRINTYKESIEKLSAKDANKAKNVLKDKKFVRVKVGTFK